MAKDANRGAPPEEKLVSLSAKVEMSDEMRDAIREVLDSVSELRRRVAEIKTTEQLEHRVSLLENHIKVLDRRLGRR